MKIVDSFAVEFGYELLQVVPYAYWLHKQGLLEKTISCKDTAPYYWFSPNHEEKYETREWDGDVNDILKENFPVGTIYTPTIDKSKWIVPPYKEYYKNDNFKFKKPLLIVTNKYLNEFDDKPHNFFPLSSIDEIINLLKFKYQIIYSRLDSLQKDLFADDVVNSYLVFSDKEHIKDLFEQSGMKSFNEFQCMLYANCDNYITVQGGSSALASFFSKKNLIFIRTGFELLGTYSWFNEINGSEIFLCTQWDMMSTAINDIFI